MTATTKKANLGYYWLGNVRWGDPQNDPYRVIRTEDSHWRSTLKIHVGICRPLEFLTTDAQSISIFSYRSMADTIRWCHTISSDFCHFEHTDANVKLKVIISDRWYTAGSSNTLQSRTLQKRDWHRETPNKRMVTECPFVIVAVS